MIRKVLATGLVAIAMLSPARAEEPVLKKAIEQVKKGSPGDTRKSVKLGAIEVILSERARFVPGVEQSIGTDSTVETRRAGKTIAKAEFKGLDAVGGYTGIQLIRPRLQELKDFLFVKKVGNYDTRLLVVDSKGRIFDLPFGTTYISPDEGRLFSIRTVPGETGAYSVLDLKAGKLLSQVRDDSKAEEFDRASRVFREGIVYQLFVSAGKIFGVATEKDPVKPEQARELAASSMVRFDPANGEFTVEKRDPALSKGAVALKELF